MIHACIKRVYEDASPEDGYRMLVDRIWPRGVKKQDAKLDEWNKLIAPTTELRKWFNHQPERFEEFVKRYRKELLQNKTELNRIREMAKKEKVTLLYGAKDHELNQANVLLQVLESLK